MKNNSNKNLKIFQKEIEIINNVIFRMESNSFQVKKWMIAILTGLVSIRYEELINGSKVIFIVALIPIFGFWYLDAFFLKTERLYRNLYKWILKYRNETTNYLYDLNTFERRVGQKLTIISEPNHIKTMFSKTLLVFYIIPISILIIIYLYSTCFKS